MANKILTAGDDLFAWTPAQLLKGLDLDDTIDALGGDDTINAGNGSNTVYGGFGNDVVFLTRPADLTLAGVQRFYGGVGADQLIGGGLGDLLSGDKGADVLIGQGGNDTMYGGADNDTISAFSDGFFPLGTGHDVIYGGDGDDLVNVTFNVDPALYSADVYGGLGNDQIYAASGVNNLFGGDGKDQFTMFADNAAEPALSLIDGGRGIDRLDMFLVDSPLADPTNAQIVMTSQGSNLAISVNGEARATLTGIEKLVLTVEGDSTLLGTWGNDEITSIGGQLQVDAGRGFDQVSVLIATSQTDDWVYDLNGGAGVDRLILDGTGQPVGAIHLDMRGAEGVLQVGDGPEGRVTGFELFTVYGTGQNDSVYLGNQNDLILEAAPGESSGEDDFHGGGGDDRIYAGDQNDRIYGDAGSDTLGGGQGRDLIVGGDGDDVIIGGAEADRMYGQGGADVFVFEETFDSGNALGQIDNIFGFASAAMLPGEADKIDLQALGDLSFIGTANFTAAGQVRVYQAAEGSYVAINLEGNTGAEIRIALPGVTVTDLAAIDFILL